MSRANTCIMAAEAMHEWMQFGPPQLWMCTQNVAINHNINPYGIDVYRISELHQKAISEAEKALGAGWSAEPDVRLLALAILLEGAP